MIGYIMKLYFFYIEFQLFLYLYKCWKAGQNYIADAASTFNHYTKHTEQINHQNKFLIFCFCCVLAARALFYAQRYFHENSVYFQMVSYLQ